MTSSWTSPSCTWSCLASQSILEAQRLTETQVYQVAVITSDFAIAGERRTSDANRRRPNGNCTGPP